MEAFANGSGASAFAGEGVWPLKEESPADGASQTDATLLFRLLGTEGEEEGEDAEHLFENARIASEGKSPSCSSGCTEARRKSRRRCGRSSFASSADSPSGGVVGPALRYSFSLFFESRPPAASRIVGDCPQFKKVSSSEDLFFLRWWTQTRGRRVLWSGLQELEGKQWSLRLAVDTGALFCRF